jgi:hypothetical protein
VIDHYRQVLANHQMSEPERKAVQVRLAEQERFLRDLLGVQEEQAIPGKAVCKQPWPGFWMGVP